MRRFQVLVIYVVVVTLALGLSIGAAIFIRSAPAEM